MQITYTGRTAEDSAFLTNSLFGLQENALSLTPTQLVVLNPTSGWTTTFTGSGFAVNAQNEVVAGTITSLTIRDGSDVITTITGINWTFPELAAALDALSQGNDPEPLAALFSRSGGITLDASGGTGGFDMDQFLDLNTAITVGLSITGSGESDRLFGAIANDFIVAGGGDNDDIGATEGNDFIRFTSDTSLAPLIDYAALGSIAVTIDGLENTATIVKDQGQDVLQNVANALAVSGAAEDFGLFIYGTGGTDSFDVRVAPNQRLNLFGFEENDTFTIRVLTNAVASVNYSFGAESAVSVNLGTGVVANDGLGGSDTISVIGTGRLEVAATDFADTLVGSARGETFAPLAGNDTITGGDGVDGLRYDISVLDGVEVYMIAGRTEGTAGTDSFTDTFSGIEQVRGSIGNDLVVGTQGADTIEGAAGDDRLFGNFGFDTIRGGDGNDTIRGGGNADNLFGDAGNDRMFGEDGLDRVFGGLGDDYVSGDGGNDGVFGQQGNDTLLGGDGNDRFFGGIGNDLIFGQLGSDTVFGGAGFDTIFGGAGDDELWGKFNADTFVFAGAHGNDVIKDFEATNPFEKINLNGVAAITDFADLSANHMTQVGGNVVIATGIGNSITLEGVSLADLDASDFIF